MIQPLIRPNTVILNAIWTTDGKILPCPWIFLFHPLRQSCHFLFYIYVWRPGKTRRKSATWKFGKRQKQLENIFWAFLTFCNILVLSSLLYIMVKKYFKNTNEKVLIFMFLWREMVSLLAKVRRLERDAACHSQCKQWESVVRELSKWNTPPSHAAWCWESETLATSYHSPSCRNLSMMISPQEINPSGNTFISYSQKILLLPSKNR